MGYRCERCDHEWLQRDKGQVPVCARNARAPLEHPARIQPKGAPQGVLIKVELFADLGYYNVG